MGNISITLKLSLTLSKIIGSLIVLTGLYGFLFKNQSQDSIFLVSIGAAMIGLKQYFLNKAQNESK